MIIDTDKLRALAGWNQLKAAERGVFITACSVADTGVVDDRYDDDKWVFQLDNVSQAFRWKDVAGIFAILEQIERAGLISCVSGNGMYEIVAKVE